MSEEQRLSVMHTRISSKSSLLSFEENCPSKAWDATPWSIRTNSLFILSLSFILSFFVVFSRTSRKSEQSPCGVCFSSSVRVSFFFFSLHEWSKAFDQQGRGHSFPQVSGMKEKKEERERKNCFRLNVSDRGRYLKDLFTSLLDLSWCSIVILFVICFVGSWLFFGVLWYSLLLLRGDLSVGGEGDRCLVGVDSFSGSLLFSLESQQTIGYGTRSIDPRCSLGIVLLIVQSCFGLLIQALWVGLVYTRLSRPRKRRQTLLWSREGVIALRDGFLTLQIRLGDMRHRSTLVEAHIRMYFLSKRRTRENEVIPIDLVDMNVGYSVGRDRLFLNWPLIIEHRIDSSSPLYAMNSSHFSSGQFEIFVVLEGSIESTGMVTQAKTSYLPKEILWGQRFEQILHFDHERSYTVDYGQFHHTIDDPLTPHCSAKELQEQQNNNNNNA